MRLLSSAIRTSARPSTRARIRAALVTAILPPAAAALLFWLVPAACDIGLDKSTYRWTCLLPGLLIVVPPALAIVLPIASVINRRSGNHFPKGWLVTSAVAGLLTQIVLVGAYLLALDPAYRGMMLMELIFVPQPFVAGAVAGTVFWITLNLGTRSSSARGIRNTVPGNDSAS